MIVYTQCCFWPKVVEVAPSQIAKVEDTTGAGDAYLGGLITVLAEHGLPNTEEELG